jgi:hypothetical protein
MRLELSLHKYATSESSGFGEFSYKRKRVSTFGNNCLSFQVIIQLGYEAEDDYLNRYSTLKEADASLIISTNSTHIKH